MHRSLTVAPGLSPQYSIKTSRNEGRVRPINIIVISFVINLISLSLVPKGWCTRVKQRDTTKETVGMNLKKKYFKEGEG